MTVHGITVRQGMLMFPEKGRKNGRTDGKRGMAPPVRNSPTYLHTTPLPPAAFHFFEVQT